VSVVIFKFLKSSVCRQIQIFGVKCLSSDSNKVKCLSSNLSVSSCSEVSVVIFRMLKDTSVCRQIERNAQHVCRQIENKGTPRVIETKEKGRARKTKKNGNPQTIHSVYDYSPNNKPHNYDNKLPARVANVNTHRLNRAQPELW
jgi:hypothetical protein